jgi:hypothetical protein
MMEPYAGAVSNNDREANAYCLVSCGPVGRECRKRVHGCVHDDIEYGHHRVLDCHNELNHLIDTVVALLRTVWTVLLARDGCTRNHIPLATVSSPRMIFTCRKSRRHSALRCWPRLTSRGSHDPQSRLTKTNFRDLPINESCLIHC